MAFNTDEIAGEDAGEIIFIRIQLHTSFSILLIPNIRLNLQQIGKLFTALSPHRALAELTSYKRIWLDIIMNCYF